MSDFDEFTVDDTPNGQETGSTLRAKLEAAVKLLKEKDRLVADLTAKDTARTVSATWEELGVPQAIRDIYRGDTAPADIKAWWEQYKSLFNLPGAEGAPSKTDAEKEQEAALAAVQQAAALGGAGNVPTGNDAALTKAAELKQSGKPTTAADLEEFFKLAGLPKGGLIAPSM